jgi:hypothetical protein
MKVGSMCKKYAVDGQRRKNFKKELEKINETLIENEGLTLRVHYKRGSLYAEKKILFVFSAIVIFFSFIYEL